MATTDLNLSQRGGYLVKSTTSLTNTKARERLSRRDVGGWESEFTALQGDGIVQALTTPSHSVHWTSHTVQTL